ncbi:hypothetical protein LTS18_003901 [Coniosporium uncinatum]|uniref:Uncharacterized protein n=1 Tax=Coniosporium uncinatum TaxID=93489 RepID=A0ACC3DXW8_9PEZI|nr:hypothetical protein LTS18_003901 [Coniosporium uncinatum]
MVELLPTPKQTPLPVKTWPTLKPSTSETPHRMLPNLRRAQSLVTPPLSPETSQFTASMVSSTVSATANVSDLPKSPSEQQILPLSKNPSLDNGLPLANGSSPPTSSQSQPNWKRIGYRIFSRFIASEQAFFMVRRFGALNARVALALQDEITQLEDRLNWLDEYDVDHVPDKDYNNGTFRDDLNEKRKALMQQEIPKKLMEYNSFINSCAQLFNRPTVREQDRHEVEKFLKVTHPRAIDDLESGYIDRHEDLVAVHPKELSWFRTVLEWTFVLRLPVFRRQPEELQKYDELRQGDVIWPNDKRLERFCSTVIAIVGLGMLIGPLWILNFVTNTEERLGVITGFIALFFVLVAVATNARVFESLAAAAAYSAVLMVFLQMGTGPG